MSYQAVLTDLGGVVVDVASDHLVHQMAQLIGQPFESVQQAVYHEDLLVPFELGRLSATTYYERLTQRLECPWTYEQFVRAWNTACQENPPVTQLLTRLHTHYRLIAVTNTNALHLAHIKTTIPSLSMLDDWVASCEVALRKPDPHIYRVALERAGVLPHQAVYIDDRPELVDAGRSMGLMAIRFENNRQLHGELQAIGLTL